MGLAANMELKFLNKQMEKARELNILHPDEEVLAMVGLLRRSQWIMFFGVLARFMQRRYQLFVTQRRVVLVHVPAFLVHGSGFYQHTALDRPVELNLPCPAKEIYQVGVKVDLPTGFADFVGNPFAWVVFGNDAQKAFEIAKQDPQ